MSDTPSVTTVETEAAVAGDQSSLMTAEQDAAATTEEPTGDGAEQSASDAGDKETGEGGENTPPETYADFDLPEGVELDAAALEKAAPLFKELGLTQEQAQKLITLQADLVQAGSQRQAEAFTQLKQDWRNQSASDKELGGDKFNENVGVARKALDAYGTPELSKLMDDYGIGNHPEVIRFMYRVGSTLREDQPGSNAAPVSAEKDRVSLLYPNDN